MPAVGVTVFAVTPLWWLFRVRLSGRGRLCPGSASGHDRRPKYAAAGVPDRWGGPMTGRGEVWWALLDEKRPVVLLSRDGAGELGAIQVVAPACTDITDVGLEVRLGNGEGLANEGVVRAALPRTG